ncbi:unnamed protein product [Agarophyton chilense]
MGDEGVEEDIFKDLANLNEEYPFQPDPTWDLDTLFANAQNDQNKSSLAQSPGQDVLPTLRPTATAGLIAPELPEKFFDLDCIPLSPFQSSFSPLNASQINQSLEGKQDRPLEPVYIATQAEKSLVDEDTRHSSQFGGIPNTSEPSVQHMQKNQSQQPRQRADNVQDIRKRQEPKALKSSIDFLEEGNKGDSRKQVQNFSLLDVDENNSDKSLEVCLGFSDDEIEGLLEEPPAQRHSHQVVQNSRFTGNSSNALCDGGSTTKKDYHRQQMPIEQESGQFGGRTNIFPRTCSPFEGSGTSHSVRTKTVRIVTPPQITSPLHFTEVNRRKPIVGRIATPRPNSSSRRDIRDRCEIAQREVLSQSQEHQHIDKNDKNVSERVFTLEFVSNLEFQWRPIPNLERELGLEAIEMCPAPSIVLQLAEKNLSSSTIQSLRCNPRSSKSINPGNGAEMVRTPDELVFKEIYALVKSIILHRSEADIASFVSHILNKSINKNISGYFCMNFILYVEKLSTPNKLSDFHNFVFEKVIDAEIAKVQRAIEFHFGDKIASLKPESLTIAFIKKYQNHCKNQDFVKYRMKCVRDCAKEYQRKRKFLAQHGIKHQHLKHSKCPPPLEMKKLSLRRRTEQFAHEFTWYSRELFLCDFIESHYFLARFMINEIHNRKTEELLHDKLGKIGDVDKSQYFEDMEEFTSRVWTKIIKELRDFACYADPAGLMEALCADMDQKCSLILLEVNEEMNPPQKGHPPHAMLIPRFGNRIGSFSAKAFGRAGDEVAWKKKGIDVKEKNMNIVDEVYETHSRGNGIPGQNENVTETTEKNVGTR